MKMNPKQLARACADAMLVDDNTVKSLGFSLDEVEPGRAVISVTVGEHMTNGHGICHGGYIFTLADSAFAYACNTYDQRTVAQHCSITYLIPAKTGERLTATGTERMLTGRNGIYDITVTNQDGDVVAEFRGFSRTIAGAILEGGSEGK